MANYKQLLDFSNGMTAVFFETFNKMGLSIPLIFNEFSEGFNANDVKEFLQSAGIIIEGTDVKSVTESFAKTMKEVGLCQRVKVLEISDDEVKIDIGECVLGPMTKLFRGTDLNKIPPCPMMAILNGALAEKAGKRGHVESCKWVPEENTSIFTMKLEAL